MANQKFTAEFREEAVRQVLDRGYSVKEVSENLGVGKTLASASWKASDAPIAFHFPHRQAPATWSRRSNWVWGSCWIAIGTIAGIRAARGAGRGGFLCAALGLAFATAVTLWWHIEVLFAARDLLHGLDIYSGRVAIKHAIAAILVGTTFIGARIWSPWLRGQPKGLRLALMTMLAFGVFLVALTSFLDDLLPAALGQPPGRYLLELGFASTAAFGIVTWREHARTR